MVKSIADWDSYWNGSQDRASFGSGGINHPAISAFWATFFKAAGTQLRTTKTIDVASGTGAVVAAAHQAVENPGSFTCLDASEAAIATLQKNNPSVNVLVADALSIPLPDASFDLATSQFGVEYAGRDAVKEMIRLLSPNGRIALVMHSDTSIIFEESNASLDAVARLESSQFIPLAIEMFEFGFAIFHGAKPDKFEVAALKLKPAFKSLEPIMDEHGTHVAGDTICELYNEVARIQGRMKHHDQTEVLQWLKTMGEELQAYKGRMASMQDAALDEQGFSSLCDTLRDHQFDIQQAELLRVPNHPLPLAWLLTAQRQSL